MTNEVRIIGRSAAHHSILDCLQNAAQTDVEVLISGPTGVGKELYARRLHERSARAQRPFVAVNCGAVPTSLFENEMFGHVGGAFTGARTSSEGLVSEAENGSLFLDEIDALEMPSQVKLLRFLQQREYRRLGEPRVRKSNVRVVSATNSDLLRTMKEGRFREDLFFRIHVFPVAVPSLRERPEDVEPLLAEYVERYATLYKTAPIRISSAALRKLESYAWPGNVRELENCVRYLTSLRLGRMVEGTDLRLLDDEPLGRATRSGGGTPPGTPPLVGSTIGTHDGNVGAHSARFTGRSLAEAKQECVTHFERTWLIEALRAANGNIARAARNSRKPRRSFFELMRKHGLNGQDFAGRGTETASTDGSTISVRVQPALGAKQDRRSAIGAPRRDDVLA